jgi:sulfate transport system permease protein
VIFSTRRNSILPGFELSLGFVLIWLGLIVLLPLTVLVLRASGIGIAGFLALLQDSRVMGALKISFGLALIAALVNVIFGSILAWILVRHDFPLRRIVDAAVDLPFALPTAVAGISLAALYAPNGWVGALLKPYGIKIAFTPYGIVIALIFIGLPFVVRTLQPVIHELEREQEEAAATLGATRLQTLKRVIFPSLAPTLLTGFARHWRIWVCNFYCRKYPICF